MRQQNFLVDKISVAAKYLLQQNIRIDKIFAIRGDKIIYKSSEASPHCFGLAKSTVADSSLPLLVFSLKMMSPSRVAAECKAAACRPAYMSGLPPALSRPGCTGPPSQKVKKTLRRQNLRARQDFTDFY
jgi:hypothetical protein